MTHRIAKAVTLGSVLTIVLGTGAQDALASKSPEEAFTELRSALKAGELEASKLEGAFEVLTQNNWRNTWNQWRNASGGIDS